MLTPHGATRGTLRPEETEANNTNYTGDREAESTRDSITRESQGRDAEGSDKSLGINFGSKGRGGLGL